jgi:hypothetical protein
MSFPSVFKKPLVPLIVAEAKKRGRKPKLSNTELEQRAKMADDVISEISQSQAKKAKKTWHKKFDDETRGGLIGRYSKLMSVHIIGGISRLGPTSLEIWDGLLDSYGFQQMLARFCVPFVNNNYPNSHLLMMDNATIHTSPETNEFLLANNLNHFPTPPQSPDLNPIGIFSGPFSFLLILIQLFN